MSHDAAYKMRILLLTALFALSACTAQTGVLSDQGSLAGSSGSAFAAETPQTADLAAPRSSDYRVAAAFDVVTLGSGTSDGFYQIIPHEDGYANLCFTNYAAASRACVCSAPNCAHNTPACSSYIETAGFSVFPAACEDRILLVFSSYGYGSAASAPSRVECMGLNGENRRLLFTFDPGITLNDGALVSSDEIVLNGYQVSGSRVTSFIGAIGLDSGTYREIVSLENTSENARPNLFLRGVSSTGLIVKTMAAGEEGGVSSRVYELSFDGRTETELLSFTGNACYEEYNGKELVYLRFGPDNIALCKRTGAAQQEEVVVENIGSLPCVRATDLPYNQDNLYIAGFIGDYVLLNHLWDDRYDEYGNISLRYTQYAVNLSDGTAREITLSNSTMATQKPVAIMAECGDTLLVYAVEEVAGGVAYRRPGLITAQDYLNSVPAYRMVQSPVEETIRLA